jgi:hypothetical protein
LITKFTIKIEHLIFIVNFVIKMIQINSVKNITLCDRINCTNPHILRGKYCQLHRSKPKKRCVETGCKKSAPSGSDKCKGHGGGKRCVETGCKKSARGGSDKCVEHGGGKRCVETGCKKSARGGSDKCIGHGGGKRCPYCIDHIDSRSGSLKYDGYCATCFKVIFPTDPRSTKVYRHTKEMLVRNAITETSLTNELFKGFVHDIAMYTGNCDCTHRRRVDPS